jgi:flavin-dependent dehydrogenase
MLRRLAAGTPGVELMQGWSARALTSDGGRTTGVVVEDRGGERKEIGATLVVGADGRDSRIARLAGLREKAKPHGRFIYFAHYRDLPLATGGSSQMWMLEPDVAYAFPNDGGVTVLACMPAKEKLSAFKGDLEGNFEHFFEGLPLAPPVASASRVAKVMGKLEMPNVSRETVGPGVSLVGDAALATDPLWGVGCGWALQSAEWLYDCTAGARGLDRRCPARQRRPRPRPRQLPEKAPKGSRRPPPTDLRLRERAFLQRCGAADVLCGCQGP